MTKTFTALLPHILPWLISETHLRSQQLQQTAGLFDEGGTVPFIARYRKEQTGELDEVQIRFIEERLAYYRELLDRKETILSSIAEQGKLSDELAARIAVTRQKTELEDLYLPFKPKRRTKAIIARERGLEPLADLLAAQDATTLTLAELAAPFVDADKEVPDAAAALAGAGHILAERLAEDADVRARVRQLTWDAGIITSRVATDKVGTVSKFEMYYDYREALKSIPSHRMLAMRRGEVEEVLRLALEAPEAEILLYLQGRLRKGASVFAPFLGAVASDAYKRLISASIEVELRLEAKKRADEGAIAIFAGNLRNLLLAPPAGNLRVLGVDPGLRTGSKLAVIDATGKFCEHVTIYPHTGEARVAAAQTELLRLIAAHQVEMVAIGNGTAGREMEEFVKATCLAAGLRLPVVAVSEAGASIYSASDIAREEFPELDLTVRGAISIARRLQDPLAELVKLDAKSIGVGQYQHDVNQAALKKSLDAVVESCVNWVGVDLNTASWALLSYVAGIGESLAQAIVRYRDEHGPFATRKALLKVPASVPRPLNKLPAFSVFAAAVIPSIIPRSIRNAILWSKPWRLISAAVSLFWPGSRRWQSRSICRAMSPPQSACRPCATLSTSSKSRDATRAPASGWRVSAMTSSSSVISAPGCFWKGWSPTSLPLALLSTSVYIRTVWCMSVTSGTALSVIRTRR
jgi:uncharacterized protein